MRPTTPCTPEHALEPAEVSLDRVAFRVHRASAHAAPVDTSGTEQTPESCSAGENSPAESGQQPRVPRLTTPPFLYPDAETEAGLAGGADGFGGALAAGNAEAGDFFTAVFAGVSAFMEGEAAMSKSSIR